MIVARKMIFVVVLFLGMLVVSEAFAANCVLWVRNNRASWLPYGLNSFYDKTHAKGFVATPDKPKAGYVAVMNIFPPTGHVAYVKKVKDGKVTIEESNYPFGREYNTRTDKPSKLKIVGYIKK